MTTDTPAKERTLIKQKPSALFLVILNILLIFGLASYGTNAFGIILAAIATAFWFIPSILIQGFVYYLTRNRYLHPLIRIPLFLSPIILLVLSSLIFSIFGNSLEKPNKRNPAISLSGNYRLQVYAPDNGWEFHIYDLNNDGKKAHSEITDFVGHLQVYWIWDQNDRLWIYNSDDSRVYHIEKSKEGWDMIYWGYGHINESESILTPPEELYPEYAKEKVEHLDLSAE